MAKVNKLKSKPLLLAPAGNFVSLRAAIDAGADEIYFGAKELNMRANAGNFSNADLKKVVKLCHENGVKAYLALNTIVYQNELSKVDKIIIAAKKAGVDAVIAWDMAVVSSCVKHGLDIHLSTQASISNYNSLEMYKKKIPRLKRVVLARECSLDDIKKIVNLIKKNKLGVEIETFIHGAMCVSVSGRCFMSQELFGRSANRGDCLQPCRRNYKVHSIKNGNKVYSVKNKDMLSGAMIKDPEEGHELFLGEDYVMSPKDLCVMPFVDKLIEARIDAFKIEGRNRNPEYVKTVVSAYRNVIDYYYDYGRKNLDKLKRKLMVDIRKVYNRDFSSGFFLGKPLNEWCKAYGSKATVTKAYIGKVLNYFGKVNVAEIKLESGGIRRGDNIMFQGPTTGVLNQTINEMQIDGKSVDKCSKGSRVGIKIAKKVRKNDKMYKIASKV